MKILYKNACVVTQNIQREIIGNGFVSTKDQYIAGIGSGEPDENFDKVIDLEGKWLLPGFVNSHVHLGESVYFPFIQEKLTLSGYLDRTEEICASSEEIEKQRDVICKFSLYQLIQNGVTTIGGGRVTQTANGFQMPNTSGYMLMNSTKLGHFSINAYESFSKILTEENNPINKHCVFIHSLSRIGKEGLDIVKRLKSEFENLIIMIHIEEDELESCTVREKWNASSVEVLQGNGILDCNTFLIHGNHLSDLDLDIISESGSIICHCLTSNLTVADEVLDINKVLNRNIKLVVATDGPITGSGFNLLSEIRKVYQYHNRFFGKEKVSPQECLDMITINSANAIGHGGISGSIEVGKLANFLILEPPFEFKLNEIVNALIRYELVDVFGVVLNNNIVVWNKELQFEDWHKTKLDFSNLLKSI